MWRARSNEERAGSPEEWDLVRECEAFLLGGYARYLDHTGQVIPAWAWLNALAHGSADEVATLASCRTSRLSVPGPTVTWQQAQAYLAHEVQCLVEGGHTLAEVQHSTLVPLELELAARRSWPLSPADFVGRVLSALHQHQAHHHHG